MFMFENIFKLSSKVIDSGTLEKIGVLWEPKVLTRLVWLVYVYVWEDFQIVIESPR